MNILSTIWIDGAKYMTRVRLFRGRLRFHMFYMGDTDQDAHDHPWDFWTFPLTSYVEHVIDPRIGNAVRGHGLIEPQVIVAGPEKVHSTVRVVKAFRLHFRPAEHTHRVVGRYSGYYVGTDGLEHWGYPKKPGDLPLIMSDRIFTIVWTGPLRRRNWGFLKNRGMKWCWTQFEHYRWGGGKDAPCE